jgi:tyrosine-protein phosphatase YwqE
MFFKKKETGNVDLSWLVADMHSHLVPAIDDGSQDITTSVALVKGLVELGYKKIITTPHILWEVYPNTPEIISNGIGEVRKAVHEAGIAVELHAAAEYYIDDHFENHLQSKAPLLTLSSNIVLVEFSMMTAPLDLQQIIFELQIQNYQPVIAHPERYIYLSNKKEFFDDLKEAGCYFGLNLLSLTPHYGSSVQELAAYLLKKNYYDFAGTDMHNQKHLNALQRLPSSSLKKLQDSGTIKNHLL